jgi:regulator of replication initiation timing
MPPTEEEAIIAERDRLRTENEHLKRELADERAQAVRYRLAVGTERLGYR